MGAKRWQLLHKLVYLIAGLGILHFFWMRAGKNDFAEVSVYAAIVGPAAGLAGMEPLGQGTATGFKQRRSRRSLIP